MGSKQDGRAAAETGYLRRFIVAALLAAMLGVGCAGAGILAAGRQALATRVSVLGGEGAVLVQRVAMATAQYQRTMEERHLVLLKEAAASAVTVHETLASYLPPDAAALKALKDYTARAFAYAGAPIGPDGANDADIIAAAARDALPPLWSGEIAAASAAHRQAADMLSAAALGCAGLLLCVLAFAVFGVAAPALRDMRGLRAELERMAATDALTGHYNRAMLFRVAHMLIGSARRHGQALTALAIDIDDLGKINDKHGRAGGDAAIRAVAATIGATLRSSDALGRVGGTEFGIFLPATDAYHAGYAAEKLRAAVQDLPFAVKQSNVLLRVSVGIAEMHDTHKTPDDLLRAAEGALKAAKEKGKNCVVAAGDAAGA